MFLEADMSIEEQRLAYQAREAVKSFCVRVAEGSASFSRRKQHHSGGLGVAMEGAS